MKLLRIIASMDPAKGGPCQGIRNSIPALNELGCVNEVVCLDRPEAAFLGGDPFPVHALGAGRSSWSYHAGLESWLLENLPRFDAAILHGLWQYPGIALRRAARRTKSPYFIFPHGMLDPWFQREPARRIKAIRNWLYWKLIECRVVGEAEALLFTCEEEKRLAPQPFHPYRPKREITVGYGVPEPPMEEAIMHQAFRERCPDLEENRPYVLFLSRIHPKKSVDLLIRAYGRICRENAVEDGKYPALVIAGPGLDTVYGREMKSLAAALLPPASVFFTGMLQGDAKWGAFYGCEAFVLPSHQENFGIAIVEALACGKPVLISNKVNIWREIEIAKAGFVEEDSLEGALKLLRLWMLQRKVCRMENAAKTAYHHYFALNVAAHTLGTELRHAVASCRT